MKFLLRKFIQNYFAPIITSAPIITAPIITSALIPSIKKVQKQPPEVKRQSPEGFCKKGVLKNFKNFTEKHLRWSLFDKVANLQPESFLKRDSNSNAVKFPKRLGNVHFAEHLQTTASGGVL